MSSEQTLQHLSRAARIVDSDNRTNKLLHCYYLSRIQSLAAADNISVEKSYSSCLKCSTSFNDSKNFILSIKPRRIRKEKKKNKSTTNLEGKSRDKPELKFKRNFNKKQQRLVYNVAEVTCKLCNSNSKSNIRFDSKDKLKPMSTDPPIVQLSKLELGKPKKRKRDKDAGLIIRKNELSSANVVSSKPIVQPIKVLQANWNKNKVKKPKNSMAEKKTKNVAQKQRKGILLLANVLKMNDHRQQDTSQMKLNKMFK